MLSYAIIFLLIALAAGVLGFGVIAGTAATIAKVLFLVFLVLFIVSLIRGKKPRARAASGALVGPLGFEPRTKGL